MTSPDLSIIILNWNVRDLLRASLRSLAHSPALSVETIVVDSASTDGSAEMVAREFPGAHLIAAAENLGYSRGNNLGLAASRGRHLLILNPDTAIVGDALDAMVNYAEAHPAVGILGPQLLNADGSVQSSRRRFPTLVTAFFESTWLQPYAPRRVLDRYYVHDASDDATSDVDWVTGACLLVRRAVVEQIGGFDEEFFMYSEEMDFCRRARTAGWRVVYFPGAKVYHFEGKSSEQAIPERHIRFQRSKVRYFRKYHGPLAASALRLFLLLSYLQQLLLEGVKGLVGHKRELRRQRVRAYWQVLRSGLK
ncbi:MAG: glycosyltransferase family 2 protein [Chloroflexi bacterium]|nr:glycosyltransferase family 2 protein [Chloroflexota bacterium]